jgi:phage repressor protein C with HTH and peptisase S24 domain
MDSVKQAMIKWRESKGYNQDQMGDLLGVSQQVYGKIENGKRKLDVDFIVKYRMLTGIDLTELKQNEVIDSDLHEPDPIPYHKQRLHHKNSDASPYKVPFVPIKAQAGYVKAMDQEIYLDTLEKYALPPGVSGFGAIWRYWEVEGESMEPVFRPGDIILTSFVHSMDWENLRNFHVYVIVTHERIVVKRIFCKNSLEWVLISENEDHYPQQLLLVESVKEVWVYRKTWGTRASPTKRFEIKV